MARETCRYEGCSTKLTLVSITCKCEKKFCNAHRHPEDHACTYDFRAAAKDILLKTMSTAVVAKKIEAV
jgi:predicted nucleic acid binding AN1-type Zn finger protein